MISRVSIKNNEKQAKKKNRAKKQRLNTKKKKKKKKKRYKEETGKAVSPGVEPGSSAAAINSLTAVPHCHTYMF